ncbi:MAG: sigma-70 family RNA polymerase sigma factor [Saprospiraceae bacterium]|nr:sigma-70 family RNA polymerase sigma factor [Saprospiraceae bacterium]
MDELSEIISGCIKEKSKSQEELFNRFSSKMFGVCRYYAKDYTEAEDILHDGFMKVFKNINQFKGSGSFEGWMRRVFVNTALERYRKKSFMYPIEDVYETENDINIDEITSNLAANDILELIRELSPKYRMVFNLYAIEGYSHKEISKKMGISEGTSKSNLARARGILQKKVKKHFYIDKANLGTG